MISSGECDWMMSEGEQEVSFFLAGCGSVMEKRMEKGERTEQNSEWNSAQFARANIWFARANMFL
jgi:hypothetical protein